MSFRYSFLFHHLHLYWEKGKLLFADCFSSTKVKKKKIEKGCSLNIKAISNILGLFTEQFVLKK